MIKIAEKQNKIKLYYYVIFLLLTIIYNFMYFEDSFNQKLLLIYKGFVIITQTCLFFYSFTFIKQEYKINREYNITNNIYFKPLILFTTYLIILTIFQKTTFSTFNNAFFIIHSIILILTTMSFFFEYDSWIDTIYKFIIWILILCFLTQLISLILEIITSTNLINFIHNKSIKKVILYCAPGFPLRLRGLVGNSNTMAYLIVYTFYFPLIILIKKFNILNLILSFLYWSIGIICLVLTGSRGAMISLLVSFLLFVLISIPLTKRIGKQIHKKYISFIIIIISIFFISLFIIFASNAKVATNIKYLLKYVSRLDNFLQFGGRKKLWNSIFSIDLKYFVFGLSDKQVNTILNNIYPYGALNFIKNNGRAHNMYIQLLLNYGIFAFISFITFIIHIIISYVKKIKYIGLNKLLVASVFFVQLIAFLISGVFEQLPLFTLSPHSLLFSFTIGILITILSNTEKKS